MLKRMKAGKIVLGIIISVVLMIASATSQAEMARYDVDLDHSTIEFRVAHMVISKTTGRFMDYTGYIEMDPDALKVKALEAVIKTTSVNTNHEKRDAHLRGPDFFNAEGKLNRKEFGMNWNKVLDSGGVVVGDDAFIKLEMECIKAKPKG